MLYLQGLESNMVGKPMSVGNVTTVPEGPMVHLTESDASIIEFAAFSCIKL